MKKRFALLAALLIAVLGCLVLGACGIKSGNNADCKHPNAAANVTQAATCTEAGVKTYTCPDCDKTWTEPIAATGHSYAEDAAKSFAATCTEAGKKVEVCANCGDKKETPIAALGHEWQGPACKEQTCKNCTETREATAEHQWQGEVCEEQVCKVCAETHPATAQHKFVQKGQPHELEGESYDATLYCHGALYTDYECSVCHESYFTLTQPAQLHSVAEWKDSGTLTKKAGSTDCTYVGTRTGVCTDCDKPVSETYEVAGRHTYVTVVTEEATCTTEGTKVTRCLECGHVEKTVKFSDENAHKWNAGTKQGSVTTYTCVNDPNHKKTAIEAAANEKELSVPKDAFKSADELVVGGAAIEMDAATKEGLTGDNLTLGVDTLNASEIQDIDESLSDKLEGKQVYNFTLGSEQGAVTQFSGKVTVRIPYELQEGEDVDAIVIWYVNGEKIENITATYSNGFVTFETEHFSYYTVSKYTPEQMCEKYGHNYVEQKRDATCVLSGYEIKVCTRCGATPVNEVHAKLGHEMQRVEEQCTVANCTTAGKTVMKCTRCDYQTVTVTPALGHKYEAVVTEPTCTEGGYTTHTCSTCEESYKDTFTEAKGHTWDIPEPTCTQGQKCTVCNADGAKALGHVYENGVCTRCGDGCDHVWTKGNVVEPTCTEKGYTEYTCSKCGFEKREESDAPLKEHNYGENGQCTVCGATAPAVVTEYEKLIKSLKAEKYTINVDNVAVSIISAHGKDIYTTDIKINKIEGALQLTQSGELALHFTGSMEESDGKDETHEIAFELILLNSTAYLKSSYDGKESISRVPFDAMTANMEGPMSAILGYILNPEMLSGILDKISEYGDTIVSVLGKLCEKILLRNDLADGYKYTFNNAKVLELNENLYTKTVAEFIDIYFGEGAFEKLSDTLTDLFIVKKIPAAIDAVAAKAEEFGIARETLFGAVDSLLAMISQGQGPTIESIYENEQLADVTLAEMIEASAEMEAGSFKKQLDATLDMLKSAKGYELFCTLISSMGGGSHGSDMPDENGSGKPMAMAEEEDRAIVLGDGPTAEFLHDIIAAIFANKSFTFSFTTDKESAVKTFSLGVDLSLNIQQGEGTVKFSLKGGFTVTVGSGENITVPEDFDYANTIVSVLKTATQAAEGQHLVIGSGVFYLEGGKLAFVESDPWDTYIFPDVESLEIEWAEDCTDTVRILLRGKPQEYSYSHSFTFYYNSKTGEFSDKSAHQYELEPSESQTEEEAKCDSTWVEVYYCSKCGDKHVETNYKWHETYTEYELVDKNGTCLDGVIHKEVCKVCGETVSSYVEEKPEWHPTMEKTLTIEDFPHGTVTFTYWSCPCGAESGELHQSEGDGCYFDKSAWEEYYDEIPEGHMIQVRRCAIEDCTAYMVWDRWTEKKDCIVTEYSKYTFFDGSEDKPIGDPNGYLFHNSWEDHDITRNNIYHQSYENGGYRDVVEVHYNCKHGEDYTETSEWKYDEYGRMVYHLYSVEYVNNHNEDRYERESRVFEGCDYTAERYVKNGEGEEYTDTYNGTEHAHGGYVEPTCTQFGYYDNLCPVCGEGEIRYMDPPHGHEYVDNGDGLSYCRYCGLQNGQGTDGVFSLEEMTNESYKWGELDLAGDFVVGIWDKRDLGEETLYSFAFVFVDENGDEHEVQLTLGEGDYKVVWRAQPMQGYGYNSYILDISAEAVINAYREISVKVEEGWTPMGFRVTLLPMGTATEQAVSITLDREPEQYELGM